MNKENCLAICLYLPILRTVEKGLPLALKSVKRKPIYLFRAPPYFDPGGGQIWPTGLKPLGRAMGNYHKP